MKAFRRNHIVLNLTSILFIIIVNPQSGLARHRRVDLRGYLFSYSQFESIFFNAIMDDINGILAIVLISDLIFQSE